MTKNNYSTLSLDDLQAALGMVVGAGELDAITLEISKREKAERLAANQQAAAQRQQEAQHRQAKHENLATLRQELSELTAQSDDIDGLIFKSLFDLVGAFEVQTKMLTAICRVQRQAERVCADLGIPAGQPAKAGVFGIRMNDLSESECLTYWVERAIRFRATMKRQEELGWPTKEIDLPFFTTMPQALHTSPDGWKEYEKCPTT